MNPEAFGRRLGSTLRATRSHSEALGFRQQNNSIDSICVKKKSQRLPSGRPDDSKGGWKQNSEKGFQLSGTVMLETGGQWRWKDMGDLKNYLKFSRTCD